MRSPRKKSSKLWWKVRFKSYKNYMVCKKRKKSTSIVLYVEEFLYMSYDLSSLCNWKKWRIIFNNFQIVDWWAEKIKLKRAGFLCQCWSIIYMGRLFWCDRCDFENVVCWVPLERRKWSCEINEMRWSSLVVESEGSVRNIGGCTGEERNAGFFIISYFCFYLVVVFH